jgi:hypothetical protein
MCSGRNAKTIDTTYFNAMIATAVRWRQKTTPFASCVRKCRVATPQEYQEMGVRSIQEGLTILVPMRWKEVGTENGL